MHKTSDLSLLVDPVKLCRLPAHKLLRLEPKGNLLLRALDGIGAVADVAADVDGVVAADCAWGGGERVGGTENGAAGLDDFTAFPDHGADRARGHIGNETREEGLGGEVFVVLLEMLLGGAHELDGDELEATVLEARDDGADQTTLNAIRLDSDEGLLVRHFYLTVVIRFELRELIL